MKLKITLLNTILFYYLLCLILNYKECIDFLNFASRYEMKNLITYSMKQRNIPYNLRLKIVNNKTIWYFTTLFSISSHLFSGKPTMTSSCLPAKWHRRHRACILSCYHYWNQKHWPTLTNHRKAMEMKTNTTKLFTVIIISYLMATLDSFACNS